jgi:hypothetical protein
MNGILGANGVAAWMSGATVFVREWARGVLSKTQGQRLVLFGAKRDSDVVPGTVALIPDKIDTSITKENTGRNVPFTATHLGVTIERQTVVGSIVGNDQILTLHDFKQVEARVWFEFYFGSEDCPWEEGLLTEYPDGFGPAGALGPIGVIPSDAHQFLSNGPPFQAVLRNLHKPRLVEDKTALKAVLDPEHGALALDAGPNPGDPALGIRVTVYGFKQA